MSAPKLPLNIGWLSENDLLTKAALLLGYTIVPGSATTTGIDATVVGSRVATTSGTRKSVERFTLAWEDDLLFTIAQLIELEFDLGEPVYCPHCKKLQAECHRELADIAAHNDEGKQ